MPQLYWIIPLEGGHIDNSLPGGRPPHVGGGPIYHPGHPDHGLPSHERPVDPGYGQGGRPHPGNRPPGSIGGRIAARCLGARCRRMSTGLFLTKCLQTSAIVAIRRPASQG